MQNKHGNYDQDKMFASIYLNCRVLSCSCILQKMPKTREYKYLQHVQQMRNHNQELLGILLRVG